MNATQTKTVTVKNEAGLHARPADLLVRLSKQFDSEIILEHRGEKIDCKSILSILTLGAADGTELRLHVTGDDADQAMDAVSVFSTADFRNCKCAATKLWTLTRL